MPHSQHYRDSDQKLPSGGKLPLIVDLLPVGEAPSVSLVSRFVRCSLEVVEHDVHALRGGGGWTDSHLWVPAYRSWAITHVHTVTYDVVDHVSEHTDHGLSTHTVQCSAVTYDVVDHVSERPGHGSGDERHAHQHEVEDGDGGEVAGPHPPAVQP